MSGIHCTQLSFRYAERLPQNPVLDRLDVHIPLGSLWAVVGPNGAGKSTFLKLLAGILKPSSGQLDLGGVAPQQIAYLPQHTEIDRHFPINTYQLVAMGLWRLMGAFGGLNPALRNKVDAALDQVLPAYLAVSYSESYLHASYCRTQGLFYWMNPLTPSTAKQLSI
jgi:ABC-type Mn2+/Zn2+ transport system ATPase subunit